MHFMKEISAKDAFTKLKPEMVVFVISIDEEGKPNGMIVARCLKCSREPPLIAVSIAKTANTYKLIKKSKEFVVATANGELERYIEIFGLQSGKEVDKFAKTKIETEPAKIVRCPLLKKATINFECKFEKEVETGSSFLVIGRVVASHFNEGKKILFNYGKGYGDYIFKEL